jgi:hypothetical protein
MRATRPKASLASTGPAANVTHFSIEYLQNGVLSSQRQKGNLCGFKRKVEIK